MSINALIVDDEPLARKSIKRFLSSHADIRVAGECGDGQSAVAAILSEQPDLVFLDIQMPEMNGFEVVDIVGVERMPVTIFATAHDQYALRAFDVNAIDYLLKPFGKSRFERALARARERIGRHVDDELAARLVRAFESVSSRTGYVDRLPVSENGRILFVKVHEIQWIEASGNYARLHLAGRSHEIRETLASLEAQLDPKHFVRIHRSTIVNLRHVKEVHPWFHGYHLVLLENGQKLRMSRYQHQVAERLGLRERPRNGAAKSI